MASHPRFAMTGAFSRVRHLTLIVVPVSGRQETGDGTKFVEAHLARNKLGEGLLSDKLGVIFSLVG